MDYNSPDFKNVIEEQLAALPQTIKTLILGDEWKQWVGNIVKKNTLNLDQASSLEAEIFTFLIGLVGIFDLRKSIEKELAIPVSKVNDIMIDINDMIVEPLKQKLIEGTEKEDEYVSSAALPIMKHIELTKKQDEILDRQKVLDDIEAVGHAEGVGVYVPQTAQPGAMVEKKLVHINQVQPIVKDAQITQVPQNPMIAANTVVPIAKTVQYVQPTVTPVVAANVAAVKPTNIFEAKTQGVVAPQSVRTSAVVAPVSNDKSTGPDPYREPVI